MSDKPVWINIILFRIGQNTLTPTCLLHQFVASMKSLGPDTKLKTDPFKDHSVSPEWNV